MLSGTGLVKLTDFGFSKGPEDSMPKSKLGTPHYAGSSLLQNHTNTLPPSLRIYLLYVNTMHLYFYELCHVILDVIDVGEHYLALSLHSNPCATTVA